MLEAVQSMRSGKTPGPDGIPIEIYKLFPEIITNNLISHIFYFCLLLNPWPWPSGSIQKISGIKIGELEHTISLFADDVVVYLSSLNTSIPILADLIKSFGEFSGYKVNSSKSAILFLNEHERQNPKVVTPFSGTQEGFTYLGIKIVQEIENIVSLSYDPIEQSTSESLSRWMSMPISMLGRINMIKMSILPESFICFNRPLSHFHKHFFL